MQRLNPLCEEIAQKFTEAIAKNRISKAQAARDLKVSRQMLYQYLKAKSLPHHSVLQRACATWGLKLEYKGVLITEKFFPQPAIDKIPQPTVKQLTLNLQDAIAQLNDEDLNIRILRKENGRVELRVEVDFGT